MRHQPASDLPYDTTTRRRLALEALVTDKTLARYLRGEAVNDATKQRIQRAAAALGLEAPAPAVAGS